MPFPFDYNGVIDCSPFIWLNLESDVARLQREFIKRALVKFDKAGFACEVKGEQVLFHRKSWSRLQLLFSIDSAVNMLGTLTDGFFIFRPNTLTLDYQLNLRKNLAFSLLLPTVFFGLPLFIFAHGGAPFIKIGVISFAIFFAVISTILNSIRGFKMFVGITSKDLA